MAKTAKTKDGDTLLAAVHADPASDAARLVYADWLTEQGDPRGEFIALQFARLERGLDATNAKRERALAHRHWKAWAGPLAPHLQRMGTRFERGFLARCALSPLTGPKCAALLGRDEWSTVERLGLSGRFGEKDDAVRLVTHPVMRALRHVAGLDARRMAELASQATPLALESVAFEWVADTPTEVARRIAEACALPNVRHLGVCAKIWARPFNPVGELRWVFDSPLFARIETLRIAHVGPLPALLAALEPKSALREIEIVDLWDVALHGESTGHHVRFERGSDGRFSRVHVRWPEIDEIAEWVVDKLRALLEELPPDGPTSLHVVLPAKATVSIELGRTLARFSRLEESEVTNAAPREARGLVGA